MLRAVVHWSLAVVTVLVVMSGLGITEFRIVEPMTFGLLDRATAFRMHFALWLPFVVLLIAHVVLTAWPKRRRPPVSPDDNPDG